jgi:hypothetical protein
MVNIMNIVNTKKKIFSYKNSEIGEKTSFFCINENPSPHFAFDYLSAIRPKTFTIIFRARRARFPQWDTQPEFMS